MNEKQKLVMKHYKQLEREIHIGYLLKNLRAVKMIVRKKFTPLEWHRLFSKYSKLGYSSDENTYHDNSLNAQGLPKFELQ